MSEKLNELKKATMASYLAKAGKVIRADTKIASDFDDEVTKHMRVANKNHPNVYTPGHEKDPEALKKAEAGIKTNSELRDTFRRSAANRIKGIALAGRRLAKENVEQIDELKRSTVASYLSKAINRHTTNMTQGGALAGAASVVAPGETLSKDELEDHLGKKAVRQMDTRPKGMNRALKRLAKEETLVERNTESHPELWNTHELVHKSGKVLKKGDVVKGFRGHYKVAGFEMPHHSGSTGRVYVHSVNAKGRKIPGSGYGMDGKEPQSFFPSVIDAKITKKAVKEEVVNEVSRSTIAKVAQARYNQAQKALKDKNYHEYTVKMKKAIKASDATTPKTGWSHEEETQLPAAEPIVEVSAQEKYRQIRESKIRNRKGK